MHQTELKKEASAGINALLTATWASLRSPYEGTKRIMLRSNRQPEKLVAKEAQKSYQLVDLQ